ncbi:Proline/betaine transporter [Symbiodinium microadriaticum]|uniref:Proline/betaine transporter n=1 Tax=Symbiodinium microadriaticum TaxID=2951 RepID=A0A1Q9DST9_SYMMI|nr:Proline/betaine transporter [Symbiodinium microadriaticum]
MGSAADVGQVVKVYWALLLGNILEWYEFAIFSFLEPYLEVQFFNGSAISTWLGFACTFAARPFGGIVLGLLGDIFGRKVSTFLSICGMVIGTVGQGLVPSYQSGEVAGTIGLVLLVALRLLQGICTGGEIAAVSTYITEVGPKRSLARSMALIGITANIGFLLAQCASYLTREAVGASAMESWAWRIPFVIAVIPGVIATAGRRCIPESQVFLDAKTQTGATSDVFDVGSESADANSGDSAGSQGAASQPVARIKHLVKSQWPSLLVGIGSVAGASVLQYGGFLWGNVFLKKHGTTPDSLIAAGITARMLAAVLAPLVGWLADTVGVGWIQLAGTFALTLGGLPLFLVQKWMPESFGVVMAAYGVGYGIIFAPVGMIIFLLVVELFPVEVRNAGVGLSYNIGFCVFGGFAPTLFQASLSWTPWGPGWLMSCAGLASLVTFLASIWLQSTGKGNLQLAHIRPDPYFVLPGRTMSSAQTQSGPAKALSSFLDVAEASGKGGSAIQEATETKASQASKDSKDSGTRDKNDKEAVKVCEWFPVMNVQKKFCSDLMFTCVLLTFEGRCLECEAAIRSPLPFLQHMRRVCLVAEQVFPVRISCRLVDFKLDDRDSSSAPPSSKHGLAVAAPSCRVAAASESVKTCGLYPTVLLKRGDSLPWLPASTLHIDQHGPVRRSDEKEPKKIKEAVMNRMHSFLYYHGHRNEQKDVLQDAWTSQAKDARRQRTTVGALLEQKEKAARTVWAAAVLGEVQEVAAQAESSYARLVCAGSVERHWVVETSPQGVEALPALACSLPKRFPLGSSREELQGNMPVGVFTIFDCRTDGLPFAARILHEVIHHWACASRDLATFGPDKTIQFGLSFVRRGGVEPAVPWGTYGRDVVLTLLDNLQASWINDCDVTSGELSSQEEALCLALESLASGGEELGDACAGRAAVEVWSFLPRKLVCCSAASERLRGLQTAGIDVTVVKLADESFRSDDDGQGRLIDIKVDAAALLEWINSLAVVGEFVQSLDELANGKILLRVMRDVNPEAFSEHSGSELKALLRGLVEHFKGRQGCAEAVARHWLEEGGTVTSLLTQLVIWATLDNELPNHAYYVQTCQELSATSASAIVLIAERFSLDLDSSPLSSIIPGIPGFPRKSGAFTGSPGGSGALPRTLSAELPDFLEVGLDSETRFRRLKEHYIALKEEQERWEEERSRLNAELETERAKRVEAQEKERLAQAELRLADEASERAREEQRASMEMKLEQELWKATAELRQKEQEVERLREEVEISRVQAQNSQKLHSQLEMYKKRMEECQGWKREKDELRKQLDEITTSRQAGSGTVEHLHGRLANLRDDLASVSRERDEARLQVQMLQSQLEQAQTQAQSNDQEISQPTRAVETSGSGASGVLASQLGSVRDSEQERLARDLKARLDLRERELQVLHWRGQAESHALQAQETLMASCFHELGLRYHQLKVQHDLLQKRLYAEGQKMTGSTFQEVSMPPTRLAVLRHLRSRLSVKLMVNLELPGKFPATVEEWKVDAAYQENLDPCFNSVACSCSPILLLMPGQHEAATAQLSTSQFHFQRFVRAGGIDPCHFYGIPLVARPVSKVNLSSRIRNRDDAADSNSFEKLACLAQGQAALYASKVCPLELKTGCRTFHWLASVGSVLVLRGLANHHTTSLLGLQSQAVGEMSDGLNEEGVAPLGLDALPQLSVYNPLCAESVLHAAMLEVPWPAAMPSEVQAGLQTVEMQPVSYVGAKVAADLMPAANAGPAAPPALPTAVEPANTASAKRPRSSLGSAGSLAPLASLLCQWLAAKGVFILDRAGGCEHCCWQLQVRLLTQLKDQSDGTIVAGYRVNRYEVDVAQECFVRYFHSKSSSLWNADVIIEALADFGIKGDQIGFNNFCSIIEEVFQAWKYADKEDAGGLKPDAVMQLLEATGLIGLTEVEFLVSAVREYMMQTQRSQERKLQVEYQLSDSMFQELPSFVELDDDDSGALDENEADSLQFLELNAGMSIEKKLQAEEIIEWYLNASEDHTLSFSRFLSVVKRLRTLGMDEKMVESLFNHYDRDRSGKLTIKENMAQLIEEADSEGSGHLNVNELLLLVQRINERIAELDRMEILKKAQALNFTRKQASTLRETFEELDEDREGLVPINQAEVEQALAKMRGWQIPGEDDEHETGGDRKDGKRLSGERCKKGMRAMLQANTSAELEPMQPSLVIGGRSYASHAGDAHQQCGFTPLMCRSAARRMASLQPSEQGEQCKHRLLRVVFSCALS